MAGFCGMCGRPRNEAAQFCAGCGTSFPDVVRTCPTCGQGWPQPARAEVTPTARAEVTPTAVAPPPLALVNPQAPLRGAYSWSHGAAYFDGSGWFAARQLSDGSWIPDPTRPLEAFDTRSPGVVLLRAETLESAELPDVPRGPLLGPDYLPGRDCGNCGFEVAPGTGPCPNCGTMNTGPVFLPGGVGAVDHWET
ncbi:MAG: hypothetical protein QG671_2351 [Actinomycetota bacterium]|jgi:hypothetical protein|nr:hypothetical protein [Actinomycetota bacterium]MDQ5975923.1 hypothetical protein [Actinomycetota bacterium]